MGQGGCTCKHLEVKLAPLVTWDYIQRCFLVPDTCWRSSQKQSWKKTMNSRFDLPRPIYIPSWCFIWQKTWESLTPMGRVSLSLYWRSAYFNHRLPRWENQRTWRYISCRLRCDNFSSLTFSFLLRVPLFSSLATPPNLWQGLKFVLTVVTVRSNRIGTDDFSFLLFDMDMLSGNL